MRDYNLDLYAPCRCGSGKKYKFCCFQKDRQAKANPKAKDWDDPLMILDTEDPIILDLEEGERLNMEGMKLLGQNRFAEAERSFLAAIAAAPLVPAGHNNLALVVFFQGRIDEAIRIQENILNKVPIENLFGMSNLVQLYMTAGRVAAAEAIVKEAMRLKPRDPSALAKQCEALARFGRHRDILNAVERYGGDCDGYVYYFAGMAAANLGLFDQALDCLQRVKQREMLGTRAAKYASLIKTGRGPETIEGNWPYFDSYNIMPKNVLEMLIQEAEDSEPAEARLIKNPVIVDMFASLLNESGGTRRNESIIGTLGQLNHPRAAGLLKKIAEGTFGSDDLRVDAMRTLVQKGVWDRESSHKIWLQGKWTDVKPLQSEINPEAASAPMPDGLAPLYKEAMIAMSRRQWQEGEKLWREFIAKAPSFHPAYHNLAVAISQQGRNAEAETYLRKVMELDRNYIFAPCALAVIYFGEGRIAEARALLDKIIIPDKIHPQAMATYCTAQTQLAVAEKDIEKAAGWLDMAAKVDPKNVNVKELRKSLRYSLLAAKVLTKLRGKIEKEKFRLRQRVLSLDALLTDCYDIYSTIELAGMARAIGIDLTTTRRADILSAICAALENVKSVRAIHHSLRPEESAALQEVANAGGKMDYETFTRAHGTDVADKPGWREQPQSLLGRLKCRGLLVEATVNRRPSVFIPARIPLSRI